MAGRTREIIYSTEKLARFFGVTKETIQDWCKRGKLPGFKIGKEWKVRAKDIERLIEGRVRVHTKEGNTPRLF
ncbi:MAG: helix-turn-helix domain-containing protein [Candidatus Liptonbacteria bacterium]|nr:helix-turn-helix domain-containing protein [Candidatus Liptonbacteria bacterium]